MRAFYPQVNSSQYPQGIYLLVTLRLNLGMDKYEHRRLRLLEVRDRDLGGSTAALANKIERSPSYVARMLYPPGKEGRKRIAEDMVEVIETAFGWGSGWMDSVSPIPSERGEATLELPPTWALKALASLSALSPAARELVDAIVEADGKGLPPHAFKPLREMLELLVQPIAQPNEASSGKRRFGKGG
ncbi:hypothetical protein FAZ95_13950 [Trinickia violacea]|uniref:Uncharacterized protein n=1 Tax=Trinickia violacea TaxID=2571746 RepID=A0A4P8IPI4_9BURK|nr:hypothetical protein [Trinickia violacea]QCP50186.1 hypothetical protein FAZ95_13950 [Trinickia violacea]